MFTCEFIPLHLFPAAACRRGLIATVRVGSCRLQTFADRGRDVGGGGGCVSSKVQRDNRVIHDARGFLLSGDVWQQLRRGTNEELTHDAKTPMYDHMTEV